MTPEQRETLRQLAEIAKLKVAIRVRDKLLRRVLDEVRLVEHWDLMQKIDALLRASAPTNHASG